jgi:hypothetical protein
MNFQGQKDLTSGNRRYQRVIVFILHIQQHYPDILEALRRAPQFEYELEVCRYKRQWAKKYLSMLKSLVREHESGNLVVVNDVLPQAAHLAALSR